MVIIMKQTKPSKNKKPFHLHVEHFFRMRPLLIAVLGLLAVAIIKSDSKLLGVVREAYAEGYGVIGAYMREETTRAPIILNAASRTPTISSK